jgi:hypothetical protein
LAEALYQYGNMLEMFWDGCRHFSHKNPAINISCQLEPWFTTYGLFKGLAIGVVPVGDVVKPSLTRIPPSGRKYCKQFEIENNILESFTAYVFLKYWLAEAPPDERYRRYWKG